MSWIYYKCIALTWTSGISYCSSGVSQNQQCSPICKNKKQARLQVNGAGSKTHHCTLHQPTHQHLVTTRSKLNSKNGNLRLLSSFIVHNYRRSINELIVIWSIAMCAESSQRQIAYWPKTSAFDIPVGLLFLPRHPLAYWRKWHRFIRRAGIPADMALALSAIVTGKYGAVHRTGCLSTWCIHFLFLQHMIWMIVGRLCQNRAFLKKLGTS